MKFRILSRGASPQWVESAVQEYVRRLPDLSLHVMSSRPARDWEGRMFRLAGERTKRVVLDEGGNCFSSVEFANLYRGWQMNGMNVCFLVADADGFSNNMRNSADLVWSLSPLTFPHDIARLLVCEQLYRADSIVRGLPYHRQ